MKVRRDKYRKGYRGKEGKRYEMRRKEEETEGKEEE